MGKDYRRVTPVYTVSAKFRELQRLGLSSHLASSSVYVRLRCAYVRIHGLENRQGFTAFVSSNLTLSATFGPSSSRNAALGIASEFATRLPTLKYSWVLFVLTALYKGVLD